MPGDARAAFGLSETLHLTMPVRSWEYDPGYLARRGAARRGVDIGMFFTFYNHASQLSLTRIFREFPYFNLEISYSSTISYHTNLAVYS